MPTLINEQQGQPSKPVLHYLKIGGYSTTARASKAWATLYHLVKPGLIELESLEIELAHNTSYSSLGYQVEILSGDDLIFSFSGWSGAGTFFVLANTAPDSNTDYDYSIGRSIVVRDELMIRVRRTDNQTFNYGLVKANRMRVMGYES